MASRRYYTQRSEYLTLKKTPTAVFFKPTREGQREARAILEEAQHFKRGHDSERALFDFLDHFLSNGWMMVPPEAIGALTDAPIISDELFINDDGDWVSYAPHGGDAKVYGHMNYMVEDPVESWAQGKTVRFVSG